MVQWLHPHPLPPVTLKCSDLHDFFILSPFIRMQDELETWCEENPVGLFWPRLAPENASAVSPSSASSSSPSQLRLQRSHSSDAHRRRSARRRKHDRENGSSSEEDGGDPRPKTPKPRKLHVPSPELDQGSASRLQSKLEEARQRREAKARRKRDQHSPTQSMHRPGKRSGGQGQERRSRKDRTEERQKIGRMMAEGGLSQGKGLSAQERRNPNLVRRANRAEGHQQESDLTWSEGILTGLCRDSCFSSFLFSFIHCFLLSLFFLFSDSLFWIQRRE